MITTNRSANNNWVSLAGLLAACLFAGISASPAIAGAPPSRGIAQRPSDHAHSDVLTKTNVQIGEIGNTARVRLRIGDTLTVMLPANVTTGYGWQVAANDNAVLAPGTRTNLPAEQKRMGAAGRQKLLFTAKAAGRDRLVLAYTRPWEKKAAPAGSLTLEVGVARAGTDAVSTVTPAGSLLARYEGKLPCADCSGIQQAIGLWSSTPAAAAGGYYVETMTYLNAPRGDVVNIDAGKWSQERGVPSDPEATVYVLSLDSSPRTESYQLKNRGLVPLDSTRHPIDSPYNMTLHRVP